MKIECISLVIEFFGNAVILSVMKAKAREYEAMSKNI